MKEEQISSIIGQYDFLKEKKFEFQTFGSGLIHGTYLIQTSDSKYILQEFNNSVFKYPERIAHNQQVLGEKGDVSELPFALPLPILNTLNDSLTKFDGKLFRLFDFVKGETLQQIQNSEQAYLAAKAYGGFASWSKEIDASLMQESIPNFHRLDWRFENLEKAAQTSKNLKHEELEILNFYLSQKPLVEKYLDFLSKCPQRITHNDTKINNLIFTEDLEKVAAVIDLDTLMGGLLLYDFGDLVRTVACTELETSRNWENLELKPEIFQKLLEGYWEGISEIATEDEAKSLLIAGEVMTCIMGLRFFTDHLQGNIYYKVQYPEQNFHRAKNQMIFLRSQQRLAPQLKELWYKITGLTD
ncbi:aminoglycoside phosphotransferase family protein [Algoriphagus sp.]|uniref:phosphotransferase enzyme family protein n=1 Tax=Algoriphagus sp. TaxID=1872435 RepID=UPI0025FC3217|nr:aminoglycoside phosphotransferase family protein [Algoriphagus sp.]